MFAISQWKSIVGILDLLDRDMVVLQVHLILLLQLHLEDLLLQFHLNLMLHDIVVLLPCHFNMLLKLKRMPHQTLNTITVTATKIKTTNIHAKPIKPTPPTLPPLKPATT